MLESIAALLWMRCQGPELITLVEDVLPPMLAHWLGKDPKAANRCMAFYRQLFKWRKAYASFPGEGDGGDL